ncbi:MAG: polysaccharide deacetylase [Promethearchaeota archaeon CR_4]|nr:MAG: polysaccharide deacetylase [Candidatus Lokiarchaeota archaeon CR_4]
MQKSGSNIENILSIDVEDWYCDLNHGTWKFLEDRIVQNTEHILKILKRKNIGATFFVLGYFADKHPELIKEIVENNHEIGSHGYNHVAITQQTPNQFKEDVVRSFVVLEKITGEKVWGYRAPFFTLVENTAWAIDVLKSLGLRYDSSIFPFKIYKYGVPDAPLFPYHISSKNIKKNSPNEKFLEIPLSVYQIPIIRKNIPIAGGFYLRFFPSQFISYGIRQINKTRNPAILYTHPWEFDPNHPRINSIVWYNYYRLSSTEKKFEKLLSKFKFTSIRNWLENEER